MSARFHVVILGALALSLFGCTRGAEIVATVPANGQTGVSKNLSQIEIDFSTELEESTATDLNNLRVVGEASGAQTLEAELTMNVAGDTGRKLILRPAGLSNFTFADGEMVVVTVTRGIRSTSGVPIRSDAIAFEISGVSGAPDDFDPAANQYLVRSTEPQANAIGVALRPPVRVDFDVPSLPAGIAGAVVVRGDRTGFRFGGEVATSSMTQPVPSFTYALGANAASFEPGERVTVTLRPGIEAPPSAPSADPNAPNPNRALRPFSFEFEAANGVMDLAGPGLQDPVLLTPTTGELFQSVRGVAVANFAFGDGNEIAVLDESLGLALLRPSGASWFVDSVYNDFMGTPVAMQLTDLDQGRGPDLVVAVRNPNRIVVLRYATPFAPIAAYTVELGAGETPNAVRVADLNNDGTLDLIVGTATGLLIYSQLPLIPMDSNLDFQPDFHSVTGFVPLAIRVSSDEVLGFEVGDLDEDGRLDIVAVERGLGLGIYRNAGNLNLPRVQELDADFNGRVWQLADLEGDGDLDVLVAVPGGIGAYLTDTSITQPAGAVTVPISENLVVLPLPRGTPDAFRLREITGDGRPDLIAYHRLQNTLSFQPRASAAIGDFAAAREFSVATSLADAGLALGDASADGGLDVLAFGVTGASVNAISYSKSAGITPPDELPEFSFRVPSQVTGQLGDPTFSVLVSGDLSAAVNEVDIRLEYHTSLELRAIVLDPSTFPAGTATLTPTITNGVARAVIALDSGSGAVLQPGNDVPLARFDFSLRVSEVGSFFYRLRNGPVAMTTVQNSVVLEDATRVTVDLATAGVGNIQIGTSVESVINLVCTPRSEEDMDGMVTHHIDAVWERPAGVTYDAGLGGIQVRLNGGSPIDLLGAVEAYTFDGVSTGANTVRVTGNVMGLASAPTTCDVFIVAPPSDFMCTRISTMPPRVSLSWTRNANYNTLRLFRDGAAIMNDGTGLQSSFLDTTPSASGGHTYRLVATVAVSGVNQETEPVLCSIIDQDGVVTPPQSISVTASGDQVTLSWQNAESYDTIDIRRDGTLVGQVLGLATTFVDMAVPPGVHAYTLTFNVASTSSAPIATTPPTVETTLPSPTSLTCATMGSDVLLSWVNNAIYDVVEVHRLDTVTQVDTVLLAGGTDTSFVDQAVPEGTYSYRLVAMTGGFASTPRGSCQVNIRSRLAIVGLLTSLALQGEPIEIRADILDPIADSSFGFTYDPQRLSFGTSPTVILGSGVPAPPGSIADVPDTGGRRLFTVSLNGVDFMPGTNVLLATIYANVTSSFSGVGSTTLDLVTGTLGAAMPVLQDGVVAIAGDAMLTFSDVAVAGEPLEVTVYGTFDQRVVGYTTLLRFDPEVVQMLSISPLGTIAEVVDNPQFFGLLNFNNDLGYANAAFVDLSIPPQGAQPSTQNLPPSTIVPLFHFQFQVNASAVAGTDTGIELVVPEDLQDLGVTTQRPVYVNQSSTSIFPVLLNGEILVADDPTPDPTLVTPAQGSLYGGETVVIQGSSLVDDNLQVFFGGRPAQVVSSSPTSLQVIVPALVTLPNPAANVIVDVTVSHDSGAVTLVGAYTYRTATVTAVAPAQGTAGSAVLVQGSFFGTTTAGMTVRFGAAPAVIQSVNAAGTAISVLVPPGSGTVNVVTELPGQLLTLANGFSYLAAPVISGLVPATGPLVGGGTLTINGQNLAGSGVSVTFGGVAATVNASGPTSIQVVVPPLGQASAIDAPVNVVVTHSGGVSAAATYTYQILRLTSVMPASGSSAGGEPVAILGTGLLAAGTVATVGPNAGTVQSSLGDGTSLTVLTPAGSGSVDLTVTLSDGQSATLVGGFAFSVPAPTVVGIDPATGPSSGLGTVTISGTSFNLPGLSVTFGGVAAAIIAGTETATSFDAQVPPLPSLPTIDTPVDVVVTHVGGSSLPVTYTYQVLRLTGLSPAVGSPLGGNAVTLQGTGLVATGTTVAFGGVSATVVSALDSGTSLSVLAPAGSGVVDVEVNLADGQSVALQAAYTYSSLVVTSLDPVSGNPCGGDTVTLTGAGFVPGEMQVTFGGTAATSVQVDPSGASMTVTTPFVGEGVADVVVSHPATAGVVSLPGAYTFGIEFIRGDVNGDGAVNPADLSVLAVFVVGGGAMPTNLDASDVNDDGIIAVGDLVLLSAFLQQSPPITLPAPTGVPGFDPTPDFLCP